MMDEYASSITGAKANELRKLVRALVRRRFGGKAIKGSGGDWTYAGEVDGGEVFLAVDWGGQHAQLRYRVRVKTEAGSSIWRAGSRAPSARDMATGIS